MEHWAGAAWIVRVVVDLGIAEPLRGHSFPNRNVVPVWGFVPGGRSE